MQNKKFAYRKHTASLCALFILSGAIISLPNSEANRFTLLGLLCACALTVILCISVAAVYKQSLLFKIPCLLLSVFVLAEVFYEFCSFISRALLPKTPTPVIFAVFGAVCIYLCIKPEAVFLKFSLLSFVFCLFLAVFFFLCTAKDFKLCNIYLYNVPSFSKLARQCAPYLLKITLPSFVLAVYIKESRPDFGKRDLTFGVLAGLTLSLACILNSVLIFGSNLAGRLIYPYSSAVSTVTFGRLFTRLDGFVYPLYFSACLVKACVCISVIKSQITNKKT